MLDSSTPRRKGVSPYPSAPDAPLGRTHRTPDAEATRSQGPGEVALVARALLGCESARARTAALRVLEFAGGLEYIQCLEAHELGGLLRVTPRRAAQLLDALELGRTACMRLSSRRLRATPFESVADVDTWARPRLAQLPHEEVWLLSLDARGRLLRADRVGQGGVHACALLPHDILRPAVRNGASGAILVHNHPSGDPRPSADDVAMTRVLLGAFECLGIPLLDHVVVSAAASVSVLDSTQLDELAA